MISPVEQTAIKLDDHQINRIKQFKNLVRKAKGPKSRLLDNFQQNLITVYKIALGMKSDLRESGLDSKTLKEFGIMPSAKEESLIAKSKKEGVLFQVDRILTKRSK